MQTQQWTAACAGQWQGEAPASVKAFTTDSRQCRPGSAFIALPGTRVDGHAFLAQAQAQGACCAVVQHRVPEVALPQYVVPDTYQALSDIAQAYRTAFPIPLVAITGSCGKTSTRALCAAILQQVAPVLASQGSFNNHVGVPLTLFRLQPEHRYAVQEVGANHQGEIASIVAWLKPDVAVITNAAPCHLEGFGSLEGVFEAKSEILHRAPVAVLNADDPFCTRWVARAHKNPSCRVILFGRAPSASVRATDVKEEAGVTYFQLHTPRGQIPMHVHALGGHQVDNALAACAVAEAWGIPLSVMQAGIAAFRTEGSRMTEAQGLNGVRLIDDAYNANPRAMEVALSVLLAQPGKRIMVMADMLELGEDAEAYHAAFGRHAKAQGLESLYTVGQHSEAAAQAFGEGARHMASNKALIEALHPCCAEGTVMLFKGSNSMGLPSVVRALLPEDT